METNRWSVYGETTLENGLQLNWLEFVKADTEEAANAEAIRLQKAAWKGVITDCIVTKTLRPDEQL